MAIKKIAITKLKTGMLINDPVYAIKENKRILLLNGNTLITNDLQVRRLQDAGVQTVLINTEKGTDTFHTLNTQQTWADFAKTTKNAEALVERQYKAFVTAFTAAVSSNHTSRTLFGEDTVAKISREIIDFIQNNVDVLFALIRLKNVSEYTFNHSVITTILSISLADFLKIKHEDIKRFGIGSMLADLGMTSYPSKLMQRPSGLSNKEIEEINRHPIYTSAFLKKHNVDDQLIHTIILQHHERFDGTGYPNGLKGDEIHLISKLFALADVYNAMISARPHRQGIPPHMVLAEILKLSGSLFDPKMAKIFIKHVGVFPLGNMVELSDGSYGLVTGLNKVNPLKPLVLVFKTKKKIHTSQINSDEPGIIISRAGWELVDLSTGNEKYGQIRRGLDHRKFHINPQFYLDQV